MTCEMKFCEEETGHVQVDFTTKSGKNVQVDEGMFVTLELIRRLGVETFYSCEDNYGSSYLLGNGRDLLRVERLAKKLRKQGALSSTTLNVVDYLFRDRHSFEVSHFTDKGQNLRFQMHLGDVGNNSGISSPVTKCYSIHHGFRIDWRWDIAASHDVEIFLSELCARSNA